MKIQGLKRVEKAESGIHINPANKGKFTAAAKAEGETPLQHAHSVMNDPDATPLQKKRANFVINASKWRK